MIFDVLTGILNALLLSLCLIYPFRRKVKGNISRLQFHCIAGSLLVVTALVHIQLKFLQFSPSAGFIAFFALILVAATGFLKRRFMKSEFYRYAHITCACIFVLSFLIHAVQQIINLVLM